MGNAGQREELFWLANAAVASPWLSSHSSLASFCTMEMALGLCEATRLLSLEHLTSTRCGINEM